MANPEFDLAEQFALYTRKHCFITGKAGTGKTTLLKRITERTPKNVVVVAPTGVAAINAGGITIHSMFGLPLTSFVPNDDFVDLNAATNRRRLLHEHIHYRKEKLRVLKEMDTLIIDEASMVRSDILDAIDFVLRTVRRSEQPFGGVQLLLFGDLHQLPPVVKEREWNILQQYYRSPYFFDALVWPELNAAEIELQKIYRQSDARFLDLLSHIRNHEMDAEDYALLSARYDPNFKAAEKGYVLLATHNTKADHVNASELARLTGPVCSFDAQITGEFPESLYPCESVLHLKEGAQVMFIRNDSEDGKYYNGRLAVVTRIDSGNIVVSFNDSGEEFPLHREKWENIEYSLDQESGQIIKKELGTFSQYPLRLAWAITIHKSQGLTFEKVIIDAGKSFAAGQVYVALSRCRSLEGIVLHSLIPPTALYNDARIDKFDATLHSSRELQDVFAREKSLYANYLLLRLFMLADLGAHLEEWKELIDKKEFEGKEAASILYDRLNRTVLAIKGVAEKFQLQLQRMLAAIANDNCQCASLKERCHKAIEYFTAQIAEQLISPLHTHIDELAYKKNRKQYLRRIRPIEDAWWKIIDRLYNGRFLDAPLFEGDRLHARAAQIAAADSAILNKREKGDTYTDTLELFRQGKTIPEIAAIRGLTSGTIRNHIARWITKGEIDVYHVLPAETIEPVIAFISKNAETSVAVIRRELGEAYAYDDIRMIVNHHLRKCANE